MRITSISIHHYRVHRELSVRLDPARTVIGGPNESGKSTLIEAAHRALFLRARTSGKIREAMLSEGGGEHPRVTVEFESGGRAYRIEKRFSGASGRATLTEIGGTVWQDEEAETRLAELLGVEEARPAHAAQAWAHVWVAQGQSGEDPTEHANAHRDSLMARLGGGAGAAMQSEQDARLAAGIAQKRNSIFNKNGSAKAGSDLARALEAESAAASALTHAREVVERLEKASADFRSAEMAIRDADMALEKLRADSTATEARSTQVQSLRKIEQTQEYEAEAADTKHVAVAKMEERIAALRADMQRRQEKLAPQEAHIRGLDERVAAARVRVSETTEAHRAASDCAREARLRAELGAAQASLLEAEEQCAQLRVRRDAAREVRTVIAEHEAQLARLPALTAAKGKALQKLESECATAAAALEAMAATVEVVAADGPVILGGKALEAGQREVLTDTADIAIGDAVRLRITPGGGTTLAEARTRLAEARTDLQRELDALGLASVAAVLESQAERQRIDAELKADRARLAGLGGETIEADWSRADAARMTAQAEVERRARGVDGVSPAGEAGAVRALATRWAAEREKAETNEALAAKDSDAAAKAATKATDEVAAQRQAMQEEAGALARVSAELRVLEQEHGEDTARAKRLAESVTAKATAEAALALTRSAIAQLEPEVIEQDRKRLTRAIDQQNAAATEARELRAAAGATLRRDGTIDPEAALAEAEAAARFTAAQRAAVQRKADAIALLDALFTEEQRALTEHFTQPLAEKITRYVRCIFSPGARAVVRMENHAFAGIALARDGGGAFPFDVLSGGAREQVAAAVRLAMAEVLCPQHDGCLPVVFDDAFAYSDPERVQTLQRMLDLAAESGLQIIVLTCNPADYAALGAKQIVLSEARSGAVADVAPTP